MNNIIEKITTSVVEMKRMRKSLRSQVNEVFSSISKECEKENIQFSFYFDNNRYAITEIEYGFQPGHNANNSNYEFVKKEYDKYSESYNRKGFTDGYKCWVSMDNFSNDDVIYLARNIKGLLEACETELQKRIAKIDSAEKEFQSLSISISKK
jgi:hypothetical protein